MDKQKKLRELFEQIESYEIPVDKIIFYDRKDYSDIVNWLKE